MGCNTSKESVPQDEKKGNEEAAADQNEEKQEIKLSDKEANENHVEETSSSKPASAKTITLRSNGSANLTSPEHKESNTGADKEHEFNNKEEKEEEKAATKIQAAFRGHKTRKSMKQPTGKVEPSTASSQEPTREELEAEFRLDDQELCNAATKIQASFRGHMARKQGGKDDEAKKEDEEELDIDLTDPDLNKAAVKIQASFRGHMVRKEGEGEKKEEN